MNFNKAIVIGRLTGDPELRSTPSGSQVANFSIATNRKWKDKDGTEKGEVQFHNIVVWGKQAEVCKNYLKKGSEALIEGRLSTRQWETKEGQKRQTTEIVCEKLQLGAKPTGAPKVEAPTNDGYVDGDGKVDNHGINEQDLPF